MCIVFFLNDVVICIVLKPGPVGRSGAGTVLHLRKNKESQNPVKNRLQPVDICFFLKLKQRCFEFLKKSELIWVTR
jgi:hypothetical protein